MSCAVLAPATASAADYASTALAISPAGEWGSLSPPVAEATQARMYDALTPLFNHVTDAQLLQFFKSESLGAANSGPLSTELVPHPGITIARDAYDFPHITGATRDDVTWGTGWVTAEDRGLLVSQARYDSELAAIDAPGLSAFNLITSLHSFTPSKQTVAAISHQTSVLLADGARGRAVLHDIDVYLQGINAYLATERSTQAPLTRTDIYAFNALKDQFVGEGGGQQALDSRSFSPRCSDGWAPAAVSPSSRTCARAMMQRRRPAFRVT